MRLQPEIINKIQFLRTRGRSVPEISKICNISKSTALRYVKGVKILPDYYQRWIERRNSSKMISEKNWNVAVKEINALIDNINTKDWILILASLYWAEGSKKDLSFSNADPKMIRIFVSVLRNVFSVKKEDLKISLRLYEDLDKDNCLKYWSNVIGVKLNKKTSINILKGFKKGKLQYGMCRIRIRKGGLLLKKIFSVISKIDNLCPRSSTDRTMHS